MKNVTYEWERSFLSEKAFLSENTKGREHPIKSCPFRTDFQRDCDRIIHSKAFRRLMHKMQVFVAPEGDHYRTRLTHTLEVNRIAKTLARAMRLNEDLADAASLGHDLGHTPFGHSGERVLDMLSPNGFAHYKHSIRVADKLENGGKGLNLTYEVKDAILNHTGEGKAETLEGGLIKLADRIAYINHDIDDSIRAGIIKNTDIPKEISDVLGMTHGDRINSMVKSVIEFGTNKGVVGFTEPYGYATMQLREFLFERVYRNPTAKSEDKKVEMMLSSMYEYYVKNIDKLPNEYKQFLEEDGKDQVVCDFLAGMTDRYAIALFEDLFVPKSWQR